MLFKGGGVISGRSDWQRTKPILESWLYTYVPVPTGLQLQLIKKQIVLK